MVSRLFAAAMVLALAGPGFDGCQGGPTPGAIPPGTTVACFTDSDCVPMACEDLRCVASQCMVVSSMRDGDGDLHAPPPCGDDCDDTDARVFPGADEICDGRDQDCDMRVDEDAAPRAIATLLGTASQQLSAAAVGNSIVVTDTGFTSGVRLRAVDFQGHVGAGVPVLADPIEVVDVATTSAGGVVVVGRRVGPGTDHVLETYPIELTSGVLSVRPISTMTMLADGVEAIRLRAEPVGDSFVLVWDDRADDRWATMPGWAAAVQVIHAAGSSSPLDVASDGASIAVPSSATTVTFLAVADGATAGTQTFASGLADDPLTMGTHDYIVAFHDAFDHQLAHMTVSAVLPMRGAPSQGSGLPLRVDETSFGPLVTRFDALNTHRLGIGVWALLMPETLDAVRADFPPSTVSAGIGGSALGFDVVSSAAGTAVLTNFGNNGAVLTVLGCQP